MRVFLSFFCLNTKHHFPAKTKKRQVQLLDENSLHDKDSNIFKTSFTFSSFFSSPLSKISSHALIALP